MNLKSNSDIIDQFSAHPERYAHDGILAPERIEITKILDHYGLEVKFARINGTFALPQGLVVTSFVARNGTSLRQPRKGDIYRTRVRLLPWIEVS